MAGDELSAGRDAQAQVDTVVRGWLVEVDAALTGPRRWRADVLDELRDGLLEATEWRVRVGSAPVAAAAAAVAEFGDPRRVGAELGAEGAAVLARRVGAAVLASGPLAAVSWVTAFAVTSVPVLRGQLAGVWWAMPVLGVLLAVVIPSAVMAVRARSDRPGDVASAGRTWSPLTCARVAATGCVGADVLMLALFGIWVAGRAPETGWWFASGAVAISTVRLIVTLCAARACAHTAARAARP